MRVLQWSFTLHKACSWTYAYSYKQWGLPWAAVQISAEFCGVVQSEHMLVPWQWSADPMQCTAIIKPKKLLQLPS